MTTNGLIITPLQEKDLPTFVQIELEAFRSHPRIPMLWPNGYTPDLYAFYQDGKMESYHDKQSRFMKAVDQQSGQIIAASEWSFVLDSEVESKKELTSPDEQPPSNWPQNGNWALRLFFKIEWEKWRRQTFAGRPYIVLDILVTNPVHAGRGAGTKLLTWGVKQAEKHCVPICLESTPAGLSLYKRFDFKEVRTVKADMKLFGWQETYDEEDAKRFWMVREPQGQS